MNTVLIDTTTYFNPVDMLDRALKKIQGTDAILIYFIAENPTERLASVRVLWDYTRNPRNSLGQYLSKVKQLVRVVGHSKVLTYCSGPIKFGEHIRMDFAKEVARGEYGLRATDPTIIDLRKV